jgi:hypothetical protein
MISGHTAYVFWLVKMPQSGEDECRPDLWHQRGAVAERYAKKETAFGGGVGTFTSGVRGCESCGMETVRCVSSVGLGSVACIPGTGTQKLLVQQVMLMPRH